MYAGLDTDAYPGDVWAKRVYDETNIWYLGYYLGGVNAAKGTETWRGKRKTLCDMGFGLIPIYVGMQADSKQFYSTLTAQQGKVDGVDAVVIMEQQGFPKNSVVYLDVEGRVADPKLITYIAAWVHTVNKAGYRAGVYCDATTVAPALLKKRDNFYLWAVPAGEDIWISVIPQTDTSGRLIYPTYDPRDTHTSAFAVQYAEAGFSSEPPNIFDVDVDLNSCLEKDPSMPEGGKVVTGQDIVNSAHKLLGAPYRFWTAGAPLPMWLNDGAGNPPPAEHLLQAGVMCADLVSWAMRDNGLDTVYGTENFEDFLVDTSDFDPNSPGVPGAIAYDPFISSAEGQQGHIAIFVDGQRLIQSLTFNGSTFPGVTAAYDQLATYNWGGDTLFTRYGFLPGVDYSGAQPAPAKPVYRYEQNGWIDLRQHFVSEQSSLKDPWGEIDDEGKITVRDKSDYGVKL